MRPLAVTSPHEKRRVETTKERKVSRMASYTRNQRRMKMVQQRLMGLALVLICLVVLLVLSFETDPACQDCTGVLLLLPVGLWCLFSRKILIV